MGYPELKEIADALKCDLSERYPGLLLSVDKMPVSGYSIWLIFPIDHVRPIIKKLVIMVVDTGMIVCELGTVVKTVTQFVKVEFSDPRAIDKVYCVIDKYSEKMGWGLAIVTER